MDETRQRASRIAALPRPTRRWLTTLCAALCVTCLSAGCATSQESDENVKELLDTAEFHYKSAGGYFENNQVPLAIRELTLALEKDPDHVRAHYLLGYIYMGRRRYNKAVQHFKRAAEIEPQFHDAKNSLGATYLAMERWRDALGIFEELIEEPMYTSPELAHNNAGWALYNLRRYPQALDHFRMAVFLKPQFCLGYNNLGLTLSAQGSRNEAFKQFHKAVEMCPANYAEPHFNLGRLYQESGAADQARAHFQRCSELSPSAPLGERCREYLVAYR